MTEEKKMTKEQIIERLDELEMSLDGEGMDDDVRADILDEIAEMEEKLREVID